MLCTLPHMTPLSGFVPGFHSTETEKVQLGPKGTRSYSGSSDKSSDYRSLEGFFGLVTIIFKDM